MENEETPIESEKKHFNTQKALVVAGDVLVLANAAIVVKKIFTASAVAFRNYRAN